MGFKNAFALCLYLLSSSISVSAQSPGHFSTSPGPTFNATTTDSATSIFPPSSTSPAPSLTALDSPTRTRLLNEDTCEDMGASFTKEINDDVCKDMGASLFSEMNEGIVKLEDELAASKGKLTQAEIDVISEVICVAQNSERGLIGVIETLCSHRELARRLALKTPEEKCADTGNFDTAALKTAAAVAKGILTAAQAAQATAEAASPVSVGAIGTAIAAVTVAEGVLYGLERAIKDIDDALDSCILKTANEINKFVQFLACPFTEYQQENTVFIGQGCDGKDNNCNSDIRADPAEKRVDECAEDQVPPTIRLRNDIPILGFTSPAEAEDWFKANIESSDDCVSNLEQEIGHAEKLDGVTGADPRLFEIEVQVSDPICKLEADAALQGEKTAAFETIETFEFIVDDIAPLVECGFDKRQDLFHVLDPAFVPSCDALPPFAGGGRDDPLHISDESPLVDVKFWYHIRDTEAPGGKKIPVNISVMSNEFEHLGRDMVEIIETRDLGEMGAIDDVHRAEVFLAPYTCHDENGGSLICKVERAGDPELNTRFYDIEVTATDEIGNVGSAKCSVIVIPEDRISKTSSNLCASKAGKSGNKPDVRRLKGQPSRLKGQPSSNIRKTELNLDMSIFSNYGGNSDLNRKGSISSNNGGNSGLNRKGGISSNNGGNSDLNRKGNDPSKKTGKSGKGELPEHDPNELRDEFSHSTQRFKIASTKLEWDTSLDVTREMPAPTPSPTFGKSGKSTSNKSSQ